MDGDDLKTPSRRRVGMSPAVQQAMFFRLVAAALAAFVVMLVASYFYLVPPGSRSIRAVVPIVHAYMLAGQANDPVRAHTTYSSRALKEKSIDDVTSDLRQREYFDDYKRLQLKRFVIKPGTSDVDPDTATVDGTVTYESRGPVEVRAQLALEGGEWLIDWIEFQPAGQ
jgi:hypothetical protein